MVFLIGAIYKTIFDCNKFWEDVYKRQDKLRNKRIENHITVSVVIDMECGNTKN